MPSWGSGPPYVDRSELGLWRPRGRPRAALAGRNTQEQGHMLCSHSALLQEHREPASGRARAGPCPGPRRPRRPPAAEVWGVWAGSAGVRISVRPCSTCIPATPGCPSSGRSWTSASRCTPTTRPSSRRWPLCLGLSTDPCSPAGPHRQGRVRLPVETCAAPDIGYYQLPEPQSPLDPGRAGGLLPGTACAAWALPPLTATLSCRADEPVNWRASGHPGGEPRQGTAGSGPRAIPQG